MIVASLVSIFSCGLEEPIVPITDVETSIEIIARTAGFNNIDVNTKAAPTDDFETAVYSAYLLLFSEENRIGFYEIDPGTLLHRVSMKGLQTVTACIIANVPYQFAEGITTITGLNSAVLDNLTYAAYAQADGHLGVPLLTVGEEQKPCIPMVGIKTENISNSTTLQIPLTRLFAKAVIELRMELGEGLLDLQRNSYFELASYSLINLPKKVRLIQNSQECAWVADKDSFIAANTQIAAGLAKKIYNGGTNGAIVVDAEKVYTFDIYVPEYILNSLPSTTEHYGDEKYKPQMYPSNKYPICLQIMGSHIPVSGASTNLEYRVYLGENASTSFTLNRNTQYNNYLRITGIDNHDGEDAVQVDHRVSISQGNMVNMFGEVANSYVISTEGKYTFPAYKGAYKLENMTPENRCTLGNDVKIIARDNNSVIFKTLENNKQFMISEDLDGAMVISFEVESMDDSNVIIALVDDNDNIEWSWHLWFSHGPTLGDLNTGFFDIATQLMPDQAGSLMMDRNLGSKISVTALDVIPSTLSGLYYKYGHRAPYFTCIQNGSLYHGYNESDYSTWDTEDKSHTDPCPPGYRVPHSSVWSGNATYEDAKFNISGFGIHAFRYWNNNNNNMYDDIYIPYAGYLDDSAKKVDAFTSAYTYTGVHEEEIQNLLYIYKSIEYKINLKYSSGSLLGSDLMFIYESVEEGIFSDIEINKCQRRSIFNDKWNDYTPTGTLAQILLENLKSQLSDEIQHLMNLHTIDPAEQNYGYQVRCVKE